MKFILSGLAMLLCVHTIFACGVCSGGSSTTMQMDWDSSHQIAWSSAHYRLNDASNFEYGVHGQFSLSANKQLTANVSMIQQGTRLQLNRPSIGYTQSIQKPLFSNHPTIGAAQYVGLALFLPVGKNIVANETLGQARDLAQLQLNYQLDIQHAKWRWVQQLDVLWAAYAQEKHYSAPLWSYSVAGSKQWTVAQQQLSLGAIAILRYKMADIVNSFKMRASRGTLAQVGPFMQWTFGKWSVKGQYLPFIYNRQQLVVRQSYVQVMAQLKF